MERVGRRGFIEASITLTLGYAYGEVISHFTQPFLGIPYQEGAIPPKDLAEHTQIKGSVIVREDPYDETPTEFIKVTPNQDVLNDMFVRVAYKDQEVARKLSAILPRRNLKITLTSEEPPGITTSQGYIHAGGTYTPIFAGGPEIKFYQGFLEGCAFINKNPNPVHQKALDTVVYHELFHLYQDIVNPFRLALKDAVVIFNEIKEGTGPGGVINAHDNEIEREAETMAQQEALNVYYDWALSGATSPWPFGRAFNFEKAG